MESSQDQIPLVIECAFRNAVRKRSNIRGHRWSDIDDAIKNLFHFVSLSLFPSLSLFLPLQLILPLLLRRSADWHFDLSDATLEYSFSRGAAVLIVFADCNLIVRQRGNWKSVRERVSPILQICRLNPSISIYPGQSPEIIRS